jgi:hypothetical protein
MAFQSLRALLFPSLVVFSISKLGADELISQSLGEVSLSVGAEKINMSGFLWFFWRRNATNLAPMNPNGMTSRVFKVSCLNPFPKTS